MKKIALLLLLCLSWSLFSSCTSSEETSSGTPFNSSITETAPATENDSEENLGIIAMTARIDTSYSFEIFSIDAETGDQQAITNFTFPRIGSNDDEDISYAPPVSSIYSSSAIEWISPDFSKIAATKFYEDNTSHAGWFDENGVFFDVTESLGLPSQSDSSRPMSYVAGGFTADNHFVYYSREYNTSGRDFCYVPLDNLAEEAIKTGNPLELQMPSFYYNSYQYYYTDRIDDTHLLADRCLDNCWGKIQSVIINMEKQNIKGIEDYIPEDSRYNWNGVLSPDATNVAFLSVSKQGQDTPKLYIMPLAGGDPIVVNTELQFSIRQAEQSPPFNLYPNHWEKGISTTLIDWR